MHNSSTDRPKLRCIDKKLRLYLIANLWRLIPGYLLLKGTDKKLRELLMDEIWHWRRCLQFSESVGTFDAFSYIILSQKQYRNLLVARLRNNRRLIRSVLVSILFRPMQSMQICCPDIGPRLYLQHGIATIISAQHIGSDCWINQQVTVGYSFDQKPPTIGNGVRITAGAKVVGDIKIGDNAIIGANAVVVKDVPENWIVGGVPAKQIGVNETHRLFPAENGTGTISPEP